MTSVPCLPSAAMAVELFAIGWTVRFSQTHDGTRASVDQWKRRKQARSHWNFSQNPKIGIGPVLTHSITFFGAGLDDCLPIFDSESDFWPTISVQLKE